MTAAAARARRDLLVTLAALAAVVLWEWSGLDLVAARAYGGPAGFPWRDAWLTSGLLHQGGRALAWAVLGLMVVDALRPLRRGPSRSERLLWLGVIIGCLVAVPAIKQLSATSCPWDLAEFGGLARHVPHWRFAVADGGPGRCFPSGHAVAAFAFFGGHFLWRDHCPAGARVWLAAVCVCGALFGWAQLARGAHYPSHTLWSAWLCWAACVAAAHRQAGGRCVVNQSVASRATCSKVPASSNRCVARGTTIS